MKHFLYGLMNAVLEAPKPYNKYTMILHFQILTFQNKTKPVLKP